MAEDNIHKDFFFSSDFKETVKNYYFVDKSLLIKDFIDGHSQVSLITRPRRFGKSLNMDMLKTFFEKTDIDTSVYFKDLKIWGCGEKYTSMQGKYPVIHLNFAIPKAKTWDKLYGSLKKTIANEYARHEKELRDLMDEDQTETFKRVKKETGTDADYTDSLRFLIMLMSEHIGIKPIVLIDEYDVPIQNGFEAGCLTDAVDFMRGVFSTGLKDNLELNFAVLTGVTRVSQASLFTGLNNLRVYPVTDGRFSQYFGFTEDEVATMLRDFDAEDKYEDVCDWYDGYYFGNTEIFNPWSVEMYIDNDFQSGTYWTKTSYFGELKTVLDNVSGEDVDKLELLASGKKIIAEIDDDIPYNELWKSENVYTMLLVSGYLTKCKVVTDKERKRLKKDEQWLVIPNREIKDVFCAEILGYANSKYDGAGEYSKKLLEAMENADVKGVQSVLNDFMKKRKMSVRNIKEGFYHGMVFGILGNIGGNYDMMSDRESGDGFVDITVETFGYGLGARDRSLPCFVLEFKYCGKLGKAKTDKMTAAEYKEKKKRLMTESAEDALEQIEKRDYARDLTETHSHVYKYGISFYGKEALAILVECEGGKDVRKVSAEGEISLE